MTIAVKVKSYRNPKLWKIHGYSVSYKKNFLFNVASFRIEDAMDWSVSKIPDLKIHSGSCSGEISLVSEVGDTEIDHSYFSGSYKDVTKSYTSTRNVGISAQNLIQAAAVLIREYPGAELLSINYVGKINAILDVREPLDMVLCDPLT